MDFAEWRQSVIACRTCHLRAGCRGVVIDRGTPRAHIMFVGEAPGESEDEQGKPFVGRAGKLLDELLGEVGFSEENVYITNVVKCRPPGNRTPTDEEAQTCVPYLRQQFLFIRPLIMVALGAVAARTLIAPDCRITKEHGRWFEKKGVAMMAIYHPAFVLRDPGRRPDVAADLALIRERYDALVSGHGTGLAG